MTLTASPLKLPSMLSVGWFLYGDNFIWKPESFGLLIYISARLRLDCNRRVFRSLHYEIFFKMTSQASQGLTRCIWTKENNKTSCSMELFLYFLYINNNFIIITAFNRIRSNVRRECPTSCAEAATCATMTIRAIARCY